MTILIFGKNGQVSSQFKNNKNIIKLGKKDFNLINIKKIDKIIKKYSPEVVINSAAVTDVNYIENYPNEAKLINSEAPKLMAKTCSELNIPFLHISTDYVFNGKLKRDYKFNDKTNPLNEYGKQKLIAERNIINNCSKYIILRTSWVFSSHKNNFVNKIIEKAKSNEILNVVDDQFGSPTSASDIAKVCLKIINKILKEDSDYGIYHFCGKPHTNRFKFAKKILKYSNLNIKIRPVKTKKNKTIPLRPKNSKLNCDSLFKKFNIKRYSWKKELIKVIKILTK